MPQSERKPTRTPRPEDLQCELARVRLAHGLSIAKLAELASCSRFQIMRLESAKFAPSLPLALRISMILGVSVEQLWRVPSYERIKNIALQDGKPAL